MSPSWHTHEQCVPGSLSSSLRQEPGKKANAVYSCLFVLLMKNKKLLSAADVNMYPLCQVSHDEQALCEFHTASEK